MAYIGKQPVVGNFQVCDAISVVNGQAAYTMQVGSTNVNPESANHMLVSLNGVLQKPGSSFTISGATITFASNLATGDVIAFIILLGNVLDIGTPSDSTVTAAKIGANAVTAAKLNADIISGTTALTDAPADTDEFLVSDAGTLKRIDYSLIKSSGTTPAFLATQANTAYSAQNFTKIQFADEKFDTDNCYDPSTNYRFTPSTAGHYYIFARVAFDNDSASSRHAAILQKNGSEIARGDIQFTGNYFTNNNTSIQVDYIIEFNGSSDYVEVSGYSEVAGDTKNTDGYGCFGGFLIKAT